jgi:hypothetical protein
MSIEPGVNTISFSVSIGRTIALESWLQDGATVHAARVHLLCYGRFVPDRGSKLPYDASPRWCSG